MKLRTGVRGTCKTCRVEIYFSEVRDPGDPWVHSDWTKHMTPDASPDHNRGKLPAYDHPAEPVMETQSFVVTVQTPAELQTTRRDIVQVLRASDYDVKVEPS